MSQPLNPNQMLIGDHKSSHQITYKIYREIPPQRPTSALPCAGCLHAICTRYEPQYEAVSLISGTDHLYNHSKPVPIPQVQADPIPQIQVPGNPTETRLQFLRR
jgi:hypothetical protein